MRARIVVTLVALIAAAACVEKKPDGAAPCATASASAAPTAPSATAAPSAAASASAAPPASASAAPASSVAASAAASASGRPSASASAGPSASAAAAAKPAAARVTGQNFVVDLAAAPCAVGQACTMTVRLAAQGDYHINKEYPYKLTMSDAAGVTMLGKSSPNVFAKPGDFREEGEKAATMTVAFKPTAAPAGGKVTLAGTYKMSVCSDANCQIEQTAISLAVPVTP
ncbi:MAG: hypothetical protein JNL38_36965 [Myxococcales bacterium]|nr:hypothetical protein [Myxococcales bacterium]